MGVLAFLCSLPALAQTYKSTIRGVVTDTSGAVVPGATVTITDVERGTARTLVTNQAGLYVAPDLTPSTYSIQISAKGFAPVERSGIGLGVAQDITVNFTIKPGTATQTVVVTGGAPLLNTTSATLGGTLSNATINNLPLNGRNFLNLLTLRPGVMIYPGGGFQTQSANGLRPTDVSYLLDGLMEYEPFQGQSIVNESNFAGDAATILPIDAIQQFNVVQNPPAQYGWAPGAVANVALKSGTNLIHGTAYAFGRDSSWDARNFYNTGPQTPLSLEQFGGSVGGPIKKNRLFYFATFEGQRYTVGNTFQASVPVTVPLPGVGKDTGCMVLATGDCTQSVPNAIADLQAAYPGFTVNPISANLLKLFPANTTSSSAIPISLPNSNRSDDFVGKIDYQLTPHQQLSYDYFFGNQSGTAMTINVLQPQFLSLLTMRVQTNGFHWTWNPSPSWVNDFRAGFNLFHQGLPAIEPVDFTKTAASYGVPTGVTNPIVGGLPDIFIAGFSMLGGDFVLPKVLGPNYNYEVDDTVSYLHGNHYFTFGTNIQHWIVNAARFANGRGRLKYKGNCGGTALECFLAGEPFLGVLLQGNPLRRVNQWASSYYFQDDWHMRPTLTVNLGMRYNYLTPLKDAHGLLGSFDPSMGLIQQGVNGVGTVYNGDHNDWSPRLGFAWNPGSGRTVVRGGFNIMYSRIDLFSMLSQVGINNALTTGLAANPTAGLIPGGTINTGVVAYGGSQLNLSGTGTIFPTGTISCTTDSPCSIMGVVRNLKNPQVFGWSLGIEHAFGQSLSVDASYVGNHGNNMLGNIDINQVNPNSPLENTTACDHCEQAGRPFNATYPYLQFINMMTNEYRSNYNALQLTVNEKGYHGLSFLLGYTWSHSLDQTGVNVSTGPQDSTNPGADYANSQWNIPQRLTFSATYAFPNARMLRPITNGWHLTSIVTLQSGSPWGPVDLGNDFSQTGEYNDRWIFFGNPSDFKVTASGIPFFPGGDPDTGGLTANAQCNSHATTPGLQANLAAFGCYAIGNSVMIPPAPGTFGTMGRNTFTGPSFTNWDASIFKDIRFGERLTAQFRAEFFNLLNHPELVNPSFNSSGFNDPSAPGIFGCGCATPDVQAQNPVLGSGGPRAIQLGLKLIF